MAKLVFMIINPAAAAGADQRRRLDHLVRELKLRGIRVDSQTTRTRGQAREIAAAAANKYDLILAVGGDGTVLEVVSGLLSVPGDKAALAIAPFGTGNDVARHLGLHSGAAVLDAISGPSVRQLDAIEVRCHGAQGPVIRHALLFAACGFAVELLRQTTVQMKRWFGPKLCYPIGFLRAVSVYQALRLQVHAGAVQLHEPLMHACAANLPFSGGGTMHHAPGALGDDGLLDMCFVRQTRRFEPFALFLRVLRGTHVKDSRTSFFRAASLEIDAEHPVDVAADGELIGVTPATFVVRPGILRVIAPLP